VIGHGRKGYLITFDGCGPQDNDTIAPIIQQGIEKGEIRLL